jgi:hypothetical protein
MAAAADTYNEKLAGIISGGMKMESKKPSETRKQSAITDIISSRQYPKLPRHC